MKVAVVGSRGLIVEDLGRQFKRHQVCDRQLQAHGRRSKSTLDMNEAFFQLI